MFHKKGPDISILKEQLRAILSIKLISSANSVLEKLLWTIISIGGSIYISYIVMQQFNYWNENPVLVTKGSKKLSDIALPAVTFCHKGMQKFSLVERLMNYIDPEKEIPDEAYAIRNTAIKSQFISASKELGFDNNYDFCHAIKDENGIFN